MKKELYILFTITIFACNQKEKVNDVKTAEIPKTEISEPSENFPGKIKNLYSGCGYNIVINKESIDLKLPLYREIKEIESILKFTGIPANFEFYSANVNNAFATIIDGKRYIIYDPNLFYSTDQNSSTYWSSMSILAHEIGHHLSGHTLNKTNNPVFELEADKFSGFILYKMGASLEQAKIAMLKLGAETDSETHPAKYRRLIAIEEGWQNANSQRFDGAIPPPPHDNFQEGNIIEFNKEMLIDKELLEYEDAEIWYGKYEFNYGVIREVSKDKQSFTVRILKQDNDAKISSGNLEGKDWEVSIESSWGANTDMCRACSDNLQYFLEPGRRIKFSMVQSCPGCGTLYNNIWSVSYIKFLPGNSF